jgi:tetratricopeptide (TPR) repeat protein
MEAESVDSLIKKGDAYAAKYEAAQALHCYLEAEKIEPNNAHLLVRIAREYRHEMSDASSHDEKLRLGGVALQYSQRAAELAPDDAEAQLAPAITYGKILPMEDSKHQFEASQRIRESAEKALKLDPHNDLAWHVLGRWHQVLANTSAIKRALAAMLFGSLPVTTNEEAVRCFKKAIELNPKRPMHHIELGRTYAQMNQNAEARCCIKDGLALPNTEKDDPELKHSGREILATLH